MVRSWAYAALAPQASRQRKTEAARRRSVTG
jgi:hypothetical protein